MCDGMIKFELDVLVEKFPRGNLNFLHPHSPPKKETLISTLCKVNIRYSPREEALSNLSEKFALFAKPINLNSLSPHQLHFHPFVALVNTKCHMQNQTLHPDEKKLNADLSRLSLHRSFVMTVCHDGQPIAHLGQSPPKKRNTKIYAD